MESAIGRMRSLSAKLIAGLTAALAGVLLWLGLANLRVLRGNLETTTVLAAQRMADVIFRSTRHGMLANNRADLIEVIGSIGAQKGVRRVRVYAKSGAIQYSTLASEIGQYVDRRADACYACHSTAKPLDKPATRNTFRIYRADDERVIGLIRPIENEPACSNAACHAHPPSQRILGVLDVVLSLDSVDRALAQHERRMTAQVVASAALLVGIVSLLVWLLISRPIRELTRGVHVLASGQLSHRFGFRRHDELGELAAAFDHMAAELEGVNRTLEQRIERKTKELEAAQEKLIHSEKLASLGQLAAAVAHEINNPLAGILTYARLIEKRLSPEKPAAEWIQTIQQESRRCGQIVNNLLVFARKHHTEMAPASVKTIVERTVAVIRHQLDLKSISLATELPELPPVYCDASQIQQVLLAIAMNAVDAISADSGGGSLAIRGVATGDSVEIALTNNGPPIPKDVLPHIFEPFFSTKQASSGVGLGLAVAYGIVKRHGGEILVETGAETTFRVRLPLRPEPAGQKETGNGAGTASPPQPPQDSAEYQNGRPEIMHSHRR